MPEGRRLFPKLTVEENLLLGAFRPTARAELTRNLAFCYETFERLKERRHQLAGSMSGGEQQIRAIARAVWSKPKRLLLDEPSLGLGPKMTEFVFEMVVRLRDEGLTVLLVEQKARQALKIAGRAYLMETGRILASGLARNLIVDQVLAKAFLGGGTTKT